MKSQLNIVMLLLVSFFYACKEDNQGVENLTYEISQEVIDGISYKCITVGDQVWMAENLKTRLDGGRAKGTMTFEEPFVTFESKESLELRKIVEKAIIKQWEDGFFNLNSVVNQESKLMIEETSGNFFNNTSRSWAAHVDWYDYWLDWQARYSRTTIDLVVNEVNRLIIEGKGIILAAAADQKYLAEHGNLYTFEACQKVVPEGWRIPSDEDWMKLEKAMGMSDEDLVKIDEWRGDVGKFLKSKPNTDGFNATMGGAYIYGFNSHNSNNFLNKDLRGYWWSSTPVESDDFTKMYFIRALRVDNGQMLRGTSPIEDNPHKDVYAPAYSIRLVKNK